MESYSIREILGLPPDFEIIKAVPTDPATSKHVKTKLDRSIDFVTQLHRSGLEIKKTTLAEIKKLYNYDRLETFDISSAEALKINAGDIPTRTEVYMRKRNFRLIRNIAKKYYFKNKFEYRNADIYEFDDMIDQIYIDMQYYCYTSDLQVMRCIGRSCLMSNHGGILYNERYMRSVKARKIISYQQTINGEDFTLENILAANSATNDPAEIVEAAEDRKDSREAGRKIFEDVIKQRIVNNFRRCDRAELLYAIMGGNDI